MDRVTRGHWPRPVHQVRRYLFLGGWVDQAGIFLCGTLIAGAVFVILAKATGQADIAALQISWSLIGLSIPASLGWAWSRRYSLAESAAWLDWKLQAGGQILARRPVKVPPRVRPMFTPQPLKKVGIPLVAWVLALLLPWAAPPKAVGDNGYLDRKLDTLETKIERIVAEQNTVEMETQQAWMDDLRQLEEQIQDHPEAAAEALDTLGARVEDDLLKRLDESLSLLEKSRKASAMQKQDRNGSHWDQLAEAMKNAGLDSENQAAIQDCLSKELADKLAEAMESSSSLTEALSKLDPETLKKLAQACQKTAMGTCQQIGDLRQALSASTQGQITQKLSELSEMMKGSPCDGGEACNGGTCDGSVCGGQPEGELPGRGGVSRGGGKSKLTFGQESNKDGMAFTPLIRKPGSSFAPGVKISERRTAPSDQPGEYQQAPRTGRTASGSTLTSDTVELSPRRRKASSTYFQQLTDAPSP